MAKIRFARRDGHGYYDVHTPEGIWLINQFIYQPDKAPPWYDSRFTWHLYRPDGEREQSFKAMWEIRAFLKELYS